MLHRLVWALVLAGAVVLIAGWWMDWDFSKVFTIYKNPPELSSVVKRGGETVKSFFDGIVQKQKEVASQAVEDVRSSAVSGAKKQAGSLIRAASEGLGIDLSSPDNGTTFDSDDEGLFAVVIIIPVNTLFPFLLKNNGTGHVSYSIDWGDGNKDEGVLSESEERIINHSWAAAGDYLISFASRNYLVRVIK